MDSEQMSQWSEELESVNRCLDLLQDNIDNSPIILPAFVKDDVDRKKHLKRIKNLSPWQKALIDKDLLKESENV